MCALDVSRDEIVGLDSERFLYNAGLVKASSVRSRGTNEEHVDVD
jgi:hypothetical protein